MSFERLSIILFLNFDLFEDIFTRTFLLDFFFPNSANNLKWIHIIQMILVFSSANLYFRMKTF